MILVTGGSFQGKRKFAELLLVKSPRCTENGTAMGPDGGNMIWTDGAIATWERFMDSPYCYNLHLFIRRVLNGEAGPACQAGAAGPAGPGGPKWPGGCLTAREDAQPELDALPAAILSGPLDRILVTDEIGCGIVPADAFERLYREETGRVCCRLAAEARQVWRVTCGMGMRIK